jgi:sulfatase maturation enzyme AslB (radical SAM superfamily)
MIYVADGLEINYLSPDEIHDWQPYREIPPANQRNEPFIQRLQDVGLWIPSQIAGRRWPIGCVSLEITQRCNLDCTLCYLSEHSEAVRDIPLEEIYRRIDMIAAHYGKNTDVQVSGGDPTLRKREELFQIVQRITDKGMRASLFTNGILATRELLAELSEAGLVDVAFHVDMTQQRKGYASEAELNVIREKYIELTRGLPLAVFFNTTIHDDNFHEVAALVQFFRRHTDVVSLVSFQLQADTGRGVLRDRDQRITPDTMIEHIQAGADKALRFDTLAVGHPSCNRYGMAFSINGNLYDCYDDPDFIVPLLNATDHVSFSRTDRRATIVAVVRAFFKAPQLWAKGLTWLARKIWSAKADLWAARGKVYKLTFMIHNFMDACHLEHDRIHACIFMVASNDGPISMCLHNAKRDEFILKPIAVDGAEGKRLWQPLSGRTTPIDVEREQSSDPKIYPIKRLKGRTRAEALLDRSVNTRDAQTTYKTHVTTVNVEDNVQ